MGFWDKIFHKSAADEWKKQQAELENWSDIVYTRKDLDMNDPVQRREYIGSCLQQMEEAARELDALEFEYNDVTSHLRDMEEINALPPEQRKEIDDCARKIVEAREFQEKFDKRKSRMTDEEFERMDRLKDNAKEASEKLLEAETFQKKIKNDLKRLDSEHEAYIFREDDLNETIENSKKLTITVGVVLVIMIVFLLILQFALKLNVIYGYMLLILLAGDFVGIGLGSREIRKLNTSIAGMEAKNEDLQAQLAQNTSGTSVRTQAVELNLISSYGARTILLTVPETEGTQMTLSTAAAAAENADIEVRMTAYAGD